MKFFLNQDFVQVVECVVLEYHLLAWSLNVVDLDFKIILVHDAKTCGDVKLFELFTECLKFRMGHCCARFCDETSSNKENLWYDFRTFVNAASVTTLLVENSSAECVSKWSGLIFFDS